MAELATIARPYAEALFRVASSADLSAWSELVAEMGQAGAHPEVQALAHNPKVSAQQKAEIFLSALKSPVSAEAKNFLNMLVENDRLTAMPEIAVQFQALKNAHQGAADAEVTSAFELSAEQLAELAKTLEQKFGRKLHPTLKVDNSLIGGVRIVVGDQVLDTSVRAKLQKMHAALTA